MTNRLMICLLLVFVYCSATAQEYSSSDYKFAITLPSKQGWGSPQLLTQSSGAVPKPVELVLVATDTLTGTRISVQVIKVDEDISMANPQMRAGFKSGLVGQPNGNFHVVAEDTSILAGVPCYRLTLYGSVQNTPLNLRMIALDANGYQYNLSSFSNDTIRTTIPSLESILSSFRFTQDPILPNVK